MGQQQQQFSLLFITISNRRTFIITAVRIGCPHSFFFSFSVSCSFSHSFIQCSDHHHHHRPVSVLCISSFAYSLAAAASEIGAQNGPNSTAAVAATRAHKLYWRVAMFTHSVVPACLSLIDYTVSLSFFLSFVPGNDGVSGSNGDGSGGGGGDSTLSPSLVQWPPSPSLLYMYTHFYIVYLSCQSGAQHCTSISSMRVAPGVPRTLECCWWCWWWIH